jgi:hypothetical protein
MLSPVMLHVDLLHCCPGGAKSSFQQRFGSAHESEDRTVVVWVGGMTEETNTRDALDRLNESCQYIQPPAFREVWDALDEWFLICDHLTQARIPR